MEFQSLKSLITNINNARWHDEKKASIRLRGALQVSKYHNLTLQGAFALIGFPEMLLESSASLARLHHSSPF